MGADAQAGPLAPPPADHARSAALSALLDRAVIGSAGAGTEASAAAKVERVSHRRRRSSGSKTTGGSTPGSGSTGSGTTTGTRFATLPPGTLLLSGATCATCSRRSSWEPRPQNATANGTVGALGASIDGNFTGTTDEIIQWASCKWGFDEDVTSARAVQESWWRQSQLGDRTSSVTACRIIGRSAPCWQSYGLLQVKGTVHRRTYPLAERSTAYNADDALAWLRACDEGGVQPLDGQRLPRRRRMGLRRSRPTAWCSSVSLGMMAQGA